MNRRSFFKNFGGLIASVAIAQRVVGDLAGKTLLALLNPVEDTNKYNRLPYYFAVLEVRRHAGMSKTWEQLFGNIEWKPNMGSTVRPLTGKLK